jgi:hypothetical protein
MLSRGRSHERQEPASYLFPVGAGIEKELTFFECPCELAQGLAPRGRHCESRRTCLHDTGRLREEVRKSLIRPDERPGYWWLSMPGDQPAGKGPGSGYGDLLAEYRAHGELRSVDAPGYAQPRRATNERREKWVRNEDFRDGNRVGVEVQEPAAALHGGSEIAQLLQPENATDVVPTVGERHYSGAIW